MSKKICSYEGCMYPLFARGYCNYHYRSEYLAKKPKKEKKSYHIPRVTNKRAKQEVEYAFGRKLFIEASRNERDRIFCIFCGKEIYGNPDLHHAMGRDDESLLDKSQWYLAHNFCHVHQYHSMSWKKCPWWPEYLARIIDNKELYANEILKMSK